MPIDYSKYPPNWVEIALIIKTEADWQCERCGKQCRRPGDPFSGHRDTLTVHHCNHEPMDCRPTNLAALCAPCHLTVDAPYKAAKRHASRDPKQKQLWNN